MAGVFLSYAREDLKRAKAVVAALEKAGHSVWWDRSLVGGSEYSSEIERALDEADAVVVLWSAESAASPWVRDEAAKGRDGGRLVPASVDGTEPPLGFRQYHTIDLTRGHSAAGLRELADAVSRKGSRGGAAAPAAATPDRPWPARRAVAAVAIVLLLAAAVAGWLHFGREGTEDGQLALAIMPFADMSPRRDQAHIGEGVAEEIMTIVSGSPGIRVIGRTSAWQLNERSADLESIRRKLGASHVLEGSVRTAGDQLRIGARLIETASGDELWSEEYRQPMTDIFAIQEAIGASVAQRLQGTVAAVREGEKARSIRTSPEAYKLYLAARAVGRRRDYKSQLEAEQLLEQALTIDPNYAPAHAYLAMTLEIIDNRRPSGRDQNRPEDTARGLSHARQAIQLAPRHAEGHIALGMVLDDVDDQAALKALARGKELDPGSFYAWNISGNIMSNHCRYRDAAEEFRRAIQIEPLLHVGYSNLVGVMEEMGRYEEAQQIARSFEATGADPVLANAILGEHYYWTGDLARSLRHWRSVESAGGSSFELGIFLGHVLHRFGRMQEAIATLPDLYRPIVGNYWRADFGAAAESAAVAPAEMWNMPFLPQVLGKAMVHAGRTDLFLNLFARRWGSTEDYLRQQECDLHQIGPTLVHALRATGRDEEASRLLDATAAEHRLRLQNGFGQPSRHAVEAAILMLQGRSDQALAKLEDAAADGWLNQGDPHWIGLNDPVFAPLRSHPRFQAVSRRIAQTLAQQAEEAAPLLASAPAASPR